MDKFTAQDFVSLRQDTVRQILEGRDDFTKRMQEERPISLPRIALSANAGLRLSGLNLTSSSVRPIRNSTCLWAEIFSEFGREPQVIITTPLEGWTASTRCQSR